MMGILACYFEAEKSSQIKSETPKIECVSLNPDRFIHIYRWNGLLWLVWFVIAVANFYYKAVCNILILLICFGIFTIMCILDSVEIRYGLLALVSVDKQKCQPIGVSWEQKSKQTLICFRFNGFCVHFFQQRFFV